MDFALKVSFPWLQAPFRLRSGVFSHPEWVATQFNLFFYLREIEDFWGSEEDERSDRPTDTNRKPQISKQIYMGVISSDSLSKNAWVHLFNSGLYSMWWSFYNQLRLSYFPLAFRLFPLWGINQNLSERKIKTRPYWIWSGFVLYSMHGY